MPIIVVEVMPKAELLDPQGKAVAGALARSGTSSFTNVRLGKRFELTLEGTADDAALAEARELAASMLSNSVIEDVVSVHFADEATSAEVPGTGVGTTGVARGEFATEHGSPSLRSGA